MGRPAALTASASLAPFACPDWADRLREGRSLVPKLPMDEAKASRAVAIFDRLRLPDVPGQPALGDAAGEWIREIVRVLFGCQDPDTRVRTVAELLLLVPKKNSKTTNGAAISVTALLMNDRPNAEMLLVGPTQEIADLAFQQAAGIIDADPDGYLQKRFHVAEHRKEITDRRNGARLKVKTFDMRVMTGAKPVFVLVDELHILGSIHYAQRVMGQIRGGVMANPESLLVMITTQSDEPPAGVFKDELQYARGVRDGRITERVRMLPVLYEFPEAMQTDASRPWADPANWPMVLPNLGLSISLERLVDDFAQAREKGEHEVRRWASQHLNVEIGLALHSARWRGADYWQVAGDPTLTLDALIERSDVIVAGVDGGGLDDLLGLALIGREKRTGRWLHHGRAWAQSDVLELRKDIAPRLRDFEAARELTVCERPTQDIDELVAILKRVNDAGLLPEANAIGLDPAGVAAIVEALKAADLSHDQLAAIPQGYRLNGAVLGAERKLKDGTLIHADQALLAWSVGNAKAEQQGNAVLITKATSGKAKIDPLMALFDAFVLMSRNPEAKGAIDYDELLANVVVS